MGEEVTYTRVEGKKGKMEINVWRVPVVSTHMPTTNTTLNPYVGFGMVLFVVEAKRRKKERCEAVRCCVSRFYNTFMLFCRFFSSERFFMGKEWDRKREKRERAASHLLFFYFSSPYTQPKPPIRKKNTFISFLAFHSMENYDGKLSCSTWDFTSNYSLSVDASFPCVCVSMTFIFVYICHERFTFTSRKPVKLCLKASTENISPTHSHSGRCFRCLFYFVLLVAISFGFFSIIRTIFNGAISSRHKKNICNRHNNR